MQNVLTFEFALSQFLRQKQTTAKLDFWLHACTLDKTLYLLVSSSFQHQRGCLLFTTCWCQFMLPTIAYLYFTFTKCL